MITQKELKSLLHYNPKSGVFTWRVDVGRFGRVKAGTVAGCIARQVMNDYIVIRINNKLYRAHRLACLYMNGDLPRSMIDHLNGNSLDNRWSNIKISSAHENTRNKRIYTRNKTGLSGVSIIKETGRYRARIKVGKRDISLGCFDNIFDAACARKSAERKYGYSLNHGREGVKRSTRGENVRT